MILRLLALLRGRDELRWDFLLSPALWLVVVGSLLLSAWLLNQER